MKVLRTMVLDPIDFDEAMELHRRWNGMWQKHPYLMEEYLSNESQWVKFCWKATLNFGEEDILAAVMMFGNPIQPEKSGIIEGRGMATNPIAPKNSASRAIALAARELSRHGFKSIVSYSVPGLFFGGMFRGSSFTRTGELKTKSGVVIDRWERNIRFDRRRTVRGLKE